MNSVTYNSDCLEAMREMPDKAFDLAIVDPPYGIDAANMTMGSGTNKQWTKKGWDASAPSPQYFSELFRVSLNQIIWGGNYFDLPQVRGWVFWDKGINGDSTFADGELAWTSFDVVMRKANVRYKGFLGMDTDRIHPTQKPVALYKWLLTNYAKQGDTILDTHLGSGSSRIAAYDLGFDFTGFELDSDYHAAQEERFARHIAQPQLFEIPRVEPIQEAMFAAA